MLYRISRVFALLLCKFFLKLEVRGKECIPRDSAFILAANHVSNLDPVIVGVASPRQLWFLAKRELFLNKFFGEYLKSIGVVPLSRGKADIKALRTALYLLREHKPVVVFPQGSRGTADRAKPGVGFLCRKAGVPVVAAYIDGTDRALPKDAALIKSAKVTVCFSWVEDISAGDSYEDISNKVLREILIQKTRLQD